MYIPDLSFSFIYLIIYIYNKLKAMQAYIKLEALFDKRLHSNIQF